MLPYYALSGKPMLLLQPLIQQMLRSNDKQLKYNTMLLLLRNKKPFPDSLLNYFAGLDEYRYELYKDLKDEKEANMFPAKYNNHLDLGKVHCWMKKPMINPIQLFILDRLPAAVKGKKGFVYFYKYKSKKG